MSDLMDMYVDAATGGRRAPARPPIAVLSRLSDLLERRPELAGIGITYLVEAVAG